jgi:maltooligosyltrehalose trehalohydrolase
VRFRVWAPDTSSIELVLVRRGRERRIPLEVDIEGFAETTVDAAAAGDRYGFVVDGAGPFPDPCSRGQPEGVHALSEVVDPRAFAWNDGGWRPPPSRELVIYELHIGTFTPGGTFAAAAARLPYLRDLGVTAVEVMPVAAFPGRWNWGYDSVALFAPCEAYGGPDGFRRFVDAAHHAGLAVILDVVYNHFGPDGNYTGLYSRRYLTPRYRTPWGDAVNFDGHGSEPVRAFFVENVQHWLHEYHVDGLRFDATHAIFDASPRHILAEIAGAVSAGSGRRRPYLIAESHENDERYVRPLARGGFGFDAVWADDFHHSLRVGLTGEREGYMRGFRGTMRELAKVVGEGWAYQGQFDRGFGERRGTDPSALPWPAFVYCLQNHDQVGNRPFGQRLHQAASAADVRAATLLHLLLPHAPLLFQGQEFMATTPFQYFTDHNPELGNAVTAGRRREFAGFAAFADPATRTLIPDPQDPATFERSRLDHGEATRGPGALALAYHRDLLRLRRSDPVLTAYRRERLPIEASASGAALTIVFSSRRGRRALVVNLGARHTISLEGAVNARVVIQSNEARFGGNGQPLGLAGRRVATPAHTAAFLELAGGA